MGTAYPAPVVAKTVLLAVALLLLAMLACEVAPGGDGGAGATPDLSPTLTRAPVEVSPTPTRARSSPPAAGLIEARVVRVVDGDTIEVSIAGREYRVRYIGIDTPETAHSPRGAEPFGAEATEANRELVAGRVVLLEKDVSETDSYGRLLRYVYVGDVMVNEELLRRGLARVVTFPPDVKYIDRFLVIQRAAREAGLGIWGVP